MSSHPRLSSSSSEDGEENNGRELPLAAAARRDDNSISFRHFLQQQSDVVPTRNPRRPPPGRNGNSSNPVSVPVDLVDIPGLLPDFVQDHLVVEAQNNGDAPHENHPVPNPVSPLDLALINEMMPTLTNSSQRQSRSANISDEAAGLDELGAYGPAPTGPSLPDFLSDGPMHCDATGSSVSSDLQPRSGRFIPSRCSTGSLGRSQIRGGSSQNTDSLLHQILRLENELQERDRRIQALENVIFEQKAELVGLYEQMTQENQGNAPETEERKLPAASICSATLEGALYSQSLSNGEGFSIQRHTNSRPVQEIATRAETLLQELMKEIQQLKKATE